MYMKNYDMFLFRLDLDEISAKTQKRQLFNTKFVIKSSFPIKVKIGGELAEDPRIRPIIASVPNSPPIKRYDQKQNSIHKTSSYENTGFSAMPRSILRVSIWNFNLVFTPHLQTNGKRALRFFFSDKLQSLLYFFRIVVSVISLEQKRKRKRACFPFVSWCMINAVSKNHIRIRTR